MSTSSAASPAPSSASTEVLGSTPSPSIEAQSLTRSAATAALHTGGRARRPRTHILQADVALQPLQLEFGMNDVEEHVAEEELPATQVDADMVDDVVHELPEQEGPDRSRAVYQRFLTRYRRWRNQQMARTEDDAGAQRLSSRLRLHGRTPEQKIRLAEEFWRDARHQGIDEEKAAILSIWRAKKEAANDRAGARWFRGHSVLWTYNGDFGNMVEIPVSMTRTASKQDEILDVVLKCQNSKQLLEMWQDFQKFVAKVVAKYHFNHYAAAFELCTQTLEQSRAVRVHAHLCCRAFQRMNIEYPSLLAWQGSEPHISRGFSQSKQRAVGGNACFYYLQCPKIGVVYQAGNIRPFDDYLVSGEWVFNLLQQQKMTISDARAQIIKSAKNLQRLLPNLEAYSKCLSDQKLEEHMAQVQQQLAAAAKPFVRIESIERWKQDHLAIRPRYKFLVLVGPSGLGKTQYAKALVPGGRALELNMAAAPEPDLKAFDHETHDLILFDECPAKVILRQKKLFQAPAVKVALAASVTGCYSYTVWVHQKLLVVCSNVWHYELRSLPSEDRDWLLSNSLVYTVEQPLWEDEDAAHNGDPSGSVVCTQGDTP